MFSGGKDSCYSTWLVQHQAWNVARLVIVKPGSEDSWMFHYPNVEWTKLQATSMSLPQTMVPGGKDEMKSLEETLRTIGRNEGIDGLVTGAVASDYQKTRFDNLCERVGLKSFSPLWHKRPETIASDLINAGFSIIMSGVAASGLDESWLGRELTPEQWGKLRVLSSRNRFHLLGEGGEYETFVIDAPMFSRKISILEAKKVWNGQSGRLVIRDASLSSSKQN
jgi:diphthine-ammonia ligase